MRCSSSAETLLTFWPTLTSRNAFMGHEVRVGKSDPIIGCCHGKLTLLQNSLAVVFLLISCALLYCAGVAGTA